MQTKCLELSECSLILQERWCLSGSTSKHSRAAFKAPPGGWQYCGSTSLGPTPAPPCQSPQGCPPGDGALQMGVSHVCSSCSSQSVLFHFIYVCVCVCWLHVYVDVYVFAASQEMPSHCGKSEFSSTPTASRLLHNGSLSTSGTFSLTSPYLSLDSTL